MSWSIQFSISPLALPLARSDRFKPARIRSIRWLDLSLAMPLTPICGWRDTLPLEPRSRSVSQLLSSPVVWCCWRFSLWFCSWANRRRICSERRLLYWLVRLLRLARDARLPSSLIRMSARERWEPRRSICKRQVELVVYLVMLSEKSLKNCVVLASFVRWDAVIVRSVRFDRRIAVTNNTVNSHFSVKPSTSDNATPTLYFSLKSAVIVSKHRPWLWKYWRTLSM